MRKLTQLLLAALGCFAVTGVYAGPEDESASEVVVSTEAEGDDSATELRLFQQGQEDDDEGKLKN